MKRGFTLVELLAVIVVLAILAFVAIPVVGNVIESGQISATENSVNFYVREIESKFSEWMIEGIPNELIYTTNGTNIEITVENLNVVLKLEGNKPINGQVVINNDYESSNSHFGYVVNATLEYEDGYVATYKYESNKSNIEIEKK